MSSPDGGRDRDDPRLEREVLSNDLILPALSGELGFIRGTFGFHCHFLKHSERSFMNHLQKVPHYFIAFIYLRADC
jgi:hypothetical protein